MVTRLMRPWDERCPECDSEAVCRLKERGEFSNDVEWTLYNAKVLYEVFGDVRKASEILRSGLERHPQEAALLACLAECYSRQSTTLQEAASVCQRTLELCPDCDYTHTIMARVQLAFGKPIEAYVSAMKALQANSLNFEAGIYLGTIGSAIAKAEGNLHEMEYSIANFRTTLSLNPGSQ